MNKPTTAARTFAERLILAFTTAQIIMATKPSDNVPGALKIMWKGDAPERLAAAIQPILEAQIKTAALDPEVLEEMLMMMKVGRDMNHEPHIIMSRVLGSALLLTFGIHPAYGDVMDMALHHQEEIFTKEQQATVQDFKKQGWELLPMVRYVAMKKTDGEAQATVHISPAGQAIPL